MLLPSVVIPRAGEHYYLYCQIFVGIWLFALVDQHDALFGISTKKYGKICSQNALADGIQLLIKALGRGVPNVIRFIISALPMFIGYALFGMLLFAQDTERVRNKYCKIC